MKHWIYTRYEQRCSGDCGRVLPEGTRVLWLPEERAILCEACAELMEEKQEEEE